MEPSLPYDATISQRGSQVNTETPAEAPSRSSRRRYNIMIFPHFRDRLACDPLNYFYAYANYEFRWSDTAAEAERGVCVLVDAIIENVREAFSEAILYFQQLPPIAQRAHTLRALATIPNTIPLHSLFNNSSNTSNSTSTIHKERREEEEEVIINNLRQQWQPPYNKPKCRIILDIIASRKTLGEDPHNSEPYRLGQKVFRFTQKKYASEVISTFVGISDSSVKLVGRDILYPYRATGGGSSSGNTASRVAVAAALASNERINSIASGSISATLTNLENLVSSTIPVPRAVIAPPANTDKVDNIRLLVCFPSWEVVGDIS